MHKLKKPKQLKRDWHIASHQSVKKNIITTIRNILHVEKKQEKGVWFLWGFN